MIDEKGAATFGPFEIIADPDARPNTLAFRTADGERVCAACGCRESMHCRVCGCRTHAAERDECLCARFVEAINICPHCGHMYGQRWRLNTHMLPTPSCQTGARAAAGRYVDTPSFEPPLKQHRDKYIHAAGA